jgi:hypothetical protein
VRVARQQRTTKLTWSLHVSSQLRQVQNVTSCVVDFRYQSQKVSILSHQQARMFCLLLLNLVSPSARVGLSSTAVTSDLIGAALSMHLEHGTKHSTTYGVII